VLTDTFSEAASYEFTTLTCIPGVIHYRGAKIQLLDLPGIIEGAKDGKGRGRQVIGTARTCDLILIVLDVTKPFTHKRIIENELEGFGIRLNKTPPDIKIQKKERGGITWTAATPLTKIAPEEIKAICSEYRLSSANVSFRTDATAEELIDVIEGNRIYTPCIYVMNKIDCITIAELDIVAELPHQVPISGRDQWNLDELLEKMFEYLTLTRIYTKPKGQIPDYGAPVVIKTARAPTVEAFVERIHRGLLKQFKHALVWGTSVKYNPQRVGLQHLLQDEDVVQIVKKV
jgi:small GTP-binding protein